MKIEIDDVKNNYQKYETYKKLKEEIKFAYNNKEYEKLILLTYPNIEDRLNSFFKSFDILDENNQYTFLLKDVVFELDKPKYIKFIKKYRKKYNKIKEINIKKKNTINISDKIFIIRVLNAINTECSKRLHDKIDMEELNAFLDDLDRWTRVRNEIVHASFVKNIDDLYAQLEYAAVKGYELSKLIDKYAKRVKSSDNKLVKN